MSDLSLYQITSAFPMLVEMDEEEITEETKKEIQEELTILLQQKSQGIIAFVRNKELIIEAKKNEEKRLEESRKKDERQLERFKQYVKECMEHSQITKIETELGSLAIAKSPISVEVTNEDEVSSKYKTEVVTTKIDKIKIKEYFKQTGEIPNGVTIYTNNTNLRIK